jgi:hypothetical protein
MCIEPLSHDLSPFTLSLFGVLCALARIERGNYLHTEALEGGQAALDIERQLADSFSNAWKVTNEARRKGEYAEAPQRIHYTDLDKHPLQRKQRYKPRKKGEAFRSALRKGYAETKASLRLLPMPETIRLETSVLHLLRDMGLSNGGRNWQHLDDALDVLSEPIKVAQFECAPLISIRRLKKGRLIIKVCGTWLNIQYTRVPLPLPIKSTLATKLLLWFRCVRPTSDYKDGNEIGFDTLCKRFGLKGERWLRSRSLIRAVETINFEYLSKIDREGLAGTKIKMPAAYAIRIVGDNDAAVSFIAHPRMTDELDGLKRAHDRTKLKRLKKARPKKRRVRIVDPDFDELGFRASRFGKGLAESTLEGIGLDQEQRLAMAALRAQYRHSQELRRQYQR